MELILRHHCLFREFRVRLVSVDLRSVLLKCSSGAEVYDVHRFIDASSSFVSSRVSISFRCVFYASQFRWTRKGRM